MAKKPKIKVAKIAAQAGVIISKRITLADYKPHQRNYNRHPDSQIADIAESLKQFGQVKPIVVWRDFIIAGHGVALAALKLGWTKLDARVLPSKWRETKALAYLAADNELARRGDPDEAQLAQIVKDIADAEGEALAQLAAGDAKALRDLMAIANPKEETADAGELIDRAAEFQKKWQVQRGDLWQCGKHRILCGDSTNADDVARVMQGERAQAIVTDSPYGIDRKGITNDDPKGLRELFDACLVNMPIENAVIINFQSPRLFLIWTDALRNAGQKFERALWFYDKTDVTYPWHGWLMTSQIALVSTFGKAKFQDDVNHHDCYLVESAGKQDDANGHTTAKPLDVVTDLVAHTVGTVYDPFLGSGTTLVACEQTGRIGRGIEIEPKYVSVALERLSLLGLDCQRIETK